MILKRYFNKKFYSNLSVILFIFFLDRITKKKLINLDQENFGRQIFSSEYLNIELVWNQGIAFGLFSFNENYAYNLLTIFIGVVILVIFIMLLKSGGFKKFSLMLIFSGAIGNLYDRIFFSTSSRFYRFSYW